MKPFEYCDTKMPYFVNTVSNYWLNMHNSYDMGLYDSLNSLRNEILMTDSYYAKVQPEFLCSSGPTINQIYCHQYDCKSTTANETSPSYNNDLWFKAINERKHSQTAETESDKAGLFSNINYTDNQTKELKSSDGEENELSDSEHRMFWLWGLTKSQTLIWSKILTPNNIQYLESLKEFDYEIKSIIDHTSTKVSFTFVCKHKNEWGKEFQRWWNLLDHCRTHKGIKPHKWNVWGKQFTQKGNLNKHLQIHS